LRRIRRPGGTWQSCLSPHCHGFLFPRLTVLRHWSFCLFQRCAPPVDEVYPAASLSCGCFLLVFGRIFVADEWYRGKDPPAAMVIWSIPVDVQWDFDENSDIYVRPRRPLPQPTVWAVIFLAQLKRPNCGRAICSLQLISTRPPPPPIMAAPVAPSMGSDIFSATKTPELRTCDLLATAHLHEASPAPHNQCSPATRGTWVHPANIDPGGRGEGGTHRFGGNLSHVRSQLL